MKNLTNNLTIGAILDVYDGYYDGIELYQDTDKGYYNSTLLLGYELTEKYTSLPFINFKVYRDKWDNIDLIKFVIPKGLEF